MLCRSPIPNPSRSLHRVAVCGESHLFFQRTAHRTTYEKPPAPGHFPTSCRADEYELGQITSDRIVSPWEVGVSSITSCFV